MSKDIPVPTANLLRQLCQALEDKKAGDLRVIRVSEVSSITDFLIVGTGTSEPHLRALRVELEKVLDAAGARILGMDTGVESGWIVVDAFDLMIHVFTPENREKYALENLWKDAEELPVADILSGVAFTGARKAPKKALEPKAAKSAKVKASKPAKPAKAAKSGKAAAGAAKKTAKAPARKTPVKPVAKTKKPASAKKKA